VTRRDPDILFLSRFFVALGDVEVVSRGSRFSRGPRGEFLMFLAIRSRDSCERDIWKPLRIYDDVTRRAEYRIWFASCYVAELFRVAGRIELVLGLSMRDAEICSVVINTLGEIRLARDDERLTNVDAAPLTATIKLRARARPLNCRGLFAR